jgi:hypothetical protein
MAVYLIWISQSYLKFLKGGRLMAFMSIFITINPLEIIMPIFWLLLWIHSEENTFLVPELCTG